MAVIQHGSLSAFSASLTRTVVPGHESLARTTSFSVLAEAAASPAPAPVTFAESDTPRGLALKSIRLLTGFDGLLGRLLWKSTNEVYFVAWAWDFSGQPIVQYPGEGVAKDACIIPLKAGDLREFIGQGICLFPSRVVSAGLAVRIQLFECDKGVRDFGKAMEEVAGALEKSKLTNLLKLAALATGATTATVTLVYEAARELASAVGTILQKNGDDYVDFYEGYFSAAEPWTPGPVTYAGHASEITLELMQ